MVYLNKNNLEHYAYTFSSWSCPALLLANFSSCSALLSALYIYPLKLSYDLVKLSYVELNIDYLAVFFYPLWSYLHLISFEVYIHLPAFYLQPLFSLRSAFFAALFSSFSLFFYLLWHFFYQNHEAQGHHQDHHQDHYLGHLKIQG